MSKQFEQEMRISMSEKSSGRVLKSRAVQTGIVWVFLILSGCTTLSSGNLIESGVVKLETEDSKSVRFTDVRVSRDDDGFKVVGHIAGHGYSSLLDPVGYVEIEILNLSGQVINKKKVGFNQRARSPRQNGPDFGEFSSHVHINRVEEGATVRLKYVKPDFH